MAFRGSYEIYGAESSYFSRKVQAIFRTMEVPHEFRLKTIAITEWLEARAGTHLIPVVLTPEDWMLWDSTPIACLLQALKPQAAIVPTTPVQRISCLLFEDWVDEWLVRPAVSSRWNYPDNAEEVALRLGANAIGRWVDEEMSDEEQASASEIGSFVRDRFGARVTRSLGALPAQNDEIRASFDLFCDLLAAHLEQHPYFLGDRISLADLGVVGAFMAHFSGDPEPHRWVAERHPELHDWVRRSFDSPVTGSWLEGDVIPPTALALLDEVGRQFHPYLRAHTVALADDQKSFSCDVGNGEVEFATVPYREASRQFIADEIACLDQSGRAQVDEVLGTRGLLDAYLDDPVPGFDHQSPRGSRHPD